MEQEPSRGSSRSVWVAIVIVLLILAAIFSPPGRRLASRFFSSLRVQKAQAVNVNLSSFVGPDANRTLQQMVSQMISSNVKTTASEKGQTASSSAQASQIAGFPVELLSARKDAPEIAVTGARSFTLTVDRARLEAILQEAGRPDLSVPGSIDGATVSVKIPRTVRARYGDCPRPPSATANIATPPPNSVQYTSCVVLAEGPSPQVNVPQGLDFSKLAEIALEVAGMSPAQSQQFLQNVNWQETLGVPIPRFMRSYESVKVGGVNGTLLNMAGRSGPTYTLIWAKNGMVYSLTGYGDSSDAASLANSLRKD
jgi:hypothetical protein